MSESPPELEDDAGPGVPEWVVTYGDMMSLLLTFFIMLVSLAELKQDKGQVRAMLDAINQRFGPTAGLSGVLGKSLQKHGAMPKRGSVGMRKQRGMKRFGRDAKGTGGKNRAVQNIDHGTEITMGGPALFEPFEANLTPGLKQNLEIIANTLSSKPNRIVVRGHTSLEPLPPDCEYSDHWDLSFHRARISAEYLIAQGIDRRRILVSAAGDTEPKKQKNQTFDQNQNRRVDVFLIDAYITHPHLLRP
jgi:chemotaxis protein MotB